MSRPLFRTNYCLYCNKEFHPHNNCKGKFCSNYCKGQFYKKDPVIKICPICKKEFGHNMKPYNVNKKIYCSYLCAARAKHLSATVIKVCPNCRMEFEVLKCSKRTFCSYLCASQYLRGINHPKFILNKSKKTHNKRPYILIAENKLGRSLLRGEHIHHIDTDRNNNSLDNLLVSLEHEHCIIHSHAYKFIFQKGWVNEYMEYLVQTEGIQPLLLGAI